MLEERRVSARLRWVRGKVTADTRMKGEGKKEEKGISARKEKGGTIAPEERAVITTPGPGRSQDVSSSTPRRGGTAPARSERLVCREGNSPF